MIYFRGLLALQEILKAEEETYVYFIDILSHEYGWTIEYIQNLTLPEIINMIKSIRNRQDLEHRITQLNIAKGFSGKISSNFNPKKEKNKENEIGNLKVLSKMLGIPTHKIKE